MHATRVEEARARAVLSIGAVVAAVAFGVWLTLRTDEPLLAFGCLLGAMVWARQSVATWHALREAMPEEIAAPGALLTLAERQRNAERRVDRWFVWMIRALMLAFVVLEWSSPDTPTRVLTRVLVSITAAGWLSRLPWIPDRWRPEVMSSLGLLIVFPLFWFHPGEPAKDLVRMEIGGLLGLAIAYSLLWALSRISKRLRIPAIAPGVVWSVLGLVAVFLAGARGDFAEQNAGVFWVWSRGLLWSAFAAVGIGILWRRHLSAARSANESTR